MYFRPLREVVRQQNFQRERRVNALLGETFCIFTRGNTVEWLRP